VDRGTRNLFALVLVGVLALTGAAALLLGGAPTASPTPSDLSSVVGVVVGVDSEGLADVRSFDLREEDGAIRAFTLDALQNGTQFPPGHLAEHQATAQPVRVWYRPGTLQAIRLEDVEPASS